LAAATVSETCGKTLFFFLSNYLHAARYHQLTRVTTVLKDFYLFFKDFWEAAEGRRGGWIAI
jgi:hypothetical protein